jgi:transposase
LRYCFALNQRRIKEMLDMADYGRIVAFKKQGRNISEIAREVGCSRNTVYEYLSGKKPEYQRKDSSVKLESYKGFINAKLEESVLYTATRLFREVKELGYSGGYTMLKVYVRGLKESVEKESMIRFETCPGKQAQVDWGEVKGKEAGGRTFKRYFLLLTLGYSRKRYLKFTERMDVFALLCCLKNGLEFMGGVPTEILSDNMTTMVTDRIEGKPVFQKDFLAFAGHYGFIPKPGIPAKPRTRGKIENGIGFVKRDFYLGRETLPTWILNQEAEKWMERVNNSVCSSHGMVVNERAKDEKLIPLPGVPFEICRLYQRKPDKTALFSFEGNYYSVPYLLSGRKVLVKAKETEILVLFDNKVVACHKIPMGKGNKVIDKNHYRKEEKTWRNNRGVQSIGEIISQSFSLSLLLGRQHGAIQVEKRPLRYYEQFVVREAK